MKRKRRAVRLPTAAAAMSGAPLSLWPCPGMAFTPPSATAEIAPSKEKKALH